jgi:glycerophosphoryl diester phosphodiesterase
MAQTSVVGLRMRGWARVPATLAPPVRGDLAQLSHRFGGVTVADADVVAAAHTGRREVHVWTVDDPGEMARLLDLGADGVLTDRPDLLRDLLVARGAWA